ncbi:hypothetical protein ACQKL5_02180 [Peribacillus sp. NPDC097675]|uniref:hypothetical protein n=1 Tax=Peribacillus sp. NPDC097675 TaxID=3390618 RepID=UPI003D07E053
MKQNQIAELKSKLTILYSNYRGLNIIAETKEDFEELDCIEKGIDFIKYKLLELTGDDSYNPSIVAVVKKYRRTYWDFHEYGAISLSELYKRKQAKIAIIKRKHKQNGIANITVNMMNIHSFGVGKEEIEVYLKNRRNKTKQLNRRKNHLDMLLQEVWAYAFYFNTRDRFEEVQDLVLQVFGPDKKVKEAKLNETRKVIKLARMLRNQL